ncbi:MAG: carbamoyltransferase [Candidatus Entotheonella factor]|uniref:Carbamoyltransferase n=1 Tax=Entotheonella factor TaxID=1429438 RepID=W4LVI8_ENTF1|nr:MAG: carbamoyltransferase [Candidatus Entotheonella factor]
MNVIGISPLDKDATVSVVVDGQVVFAAGEERFTRVKLQTGFPAQALQTALDTTGLRLDDIDTIAYPFFDWERENQLFTQNIRDEQAFLAQAQRTRVPMRTALAAVPERHEAVAGLATPNEKMRKSAAKTALYQLIGREDVVSRRAAAWLSWQWCKSSRRSHQTWQQELETHLASHGGLDKLKRYDHHLAHTANAYYASGFDRALVVTLDGYGSGIAGSASVGEGGRIRRLHTLDYPHSLGTFYESVTSALGFKPGRHEGKIVGLAAYGEPKVLLDLVLSRFHQEPGTFRMRESNNVYFPRYLASRFPKVDVAAAYQHVLEVVAANYIRHYVERTGIDTVALSGGVVANVKMNQRIFEIPGVNRIFVYPNMGDGGTGTGAAFLAARRDLKDREAYQTVYFGPAYGEAEIAAVLQAEGLPFERIEPIEPVIAQLIHQGHVVARFNGRMEYGPRALGNRSILYRATEPEVNQWLNQRLGRTEFMPFAPATLYEARHRCYDHIDGAEVAAQFMTITFNCTEFMKRHCPAAVHIDGTARPQLVRPEANPSFYRILQAYDELSGIPSLINTSFNMHEEPIVNTPEDAVRAFLQGHLDYLAIGNFLVRHPQPQRSARTEV